VQAPGFAAPTTEDVEMSLLKRFLKNENGATAIEYGLIAAGIAVAIVVVVRGVGTNLNTTFQSVKDNLQ
jgi:pilus assembly protein Flp/PilA